MKKYLAATVALLLGGALLFTLTAQGETQKKASPPLKEWAPGKIRMDKDGHYRGPLLKVHSGEAQKKTVDHKDFGKAKPSCQECHNKKELGYDFVSSEKFQKSRHYQAMLKKGQVKDVQDACLLCHVGDAGDFLPYPGDGLVMPEPFDITKAVNDNSKTCGKCHGEIAQRNKDHIMATAKGHYYRSELFPYHEALGANAEFLYKTCSVCHTSCGSSCHMVGEDGQAVDWTFVQPYLDQRVGEQREPIDVEIAPGVVRKAKPINEYLVGTYIKGGGPGYRMLAKMGKAPLETIKLDIASHEFVKPTDLARPVADDICLRCHTCMIDPQDRLETSHAHQSVRCVDCHGEKDVHGHAKNEAKYAFQGVDASCSTCHLKQDLKKGRALTSTPEREKPIVNPDIHAASPTITPLTGAHEKVSCAVCHSEGIKQCNNCHVGDLQNTVGDILEFGKKPLYYGKDKEGIVRPLLAHEIFGKDEKKYGGWIMKYTVHGIKRNVYTECEECHSDPVRMGVTAPDLKPVNTYLMEKAGVPNAYIKKSKHYEQVKAKPGTACVDCHVLPGSNAVARFHQTVRKQEYSKTDTKSR